MTAGITHRGLAVTLAALAIGGCAQVRDHKGYIVDSVLIDTVAPGIDNRDSVQKTLGRPSFASEFDKEATWYYWSRDTRQLAFSNPEATKQILLTVRFAPSGDVASVQKSGVETIRSVGLYGKTTPVLGSNRSFLAELFGNIGTVGAGRPTGGTADNPN